MNLGNYVTIQHGVFEFKGKIMALSKHSAQLCMLESCVVMSKALE
jgi:hypothetical protein